MKKIFLILLFSLTVVAKKVNAQTIPVTDTLAYLQTIVANKSQFVGRPFSVLMDSLKIQIKFFSPFAAIHYDKNKETSTQFSFFFPQTADDIYLTYPSLEIYWQPYLNIIQSDLLYSQFRSIGWNQQIATYYSSGIIADIKVFN